MKPDFSKYSDGLVPAIVQDASTRVVLMLGFMNQEALDKTLASGKVTFYSRSRQTLWTKGETSGNFLEFVDAKLDCDNDTILVKANPIGPTCHTGADTCWNESNSFDELSLAKVQQIIENELNKLPENSEIAKLLTKGGLNKVAQEVGENALDVVIQTTNGTHEKLLEKSCILLKNFLFLLALKEIKLEDIIKNLQKNELV